MILLDTCVLSEIQKPNPEMSVVEYLFRFASEDTFVSALSIGELVRGMELLSEGRRRRELERWIYNLEVRYGARILEVDTEIATVWGRIGASARKRGRHVAPVDGLIAATALQHGMHIVTRNVKDFEPTGVLIVNPWESE